MIGALHNGQLLFCSNHFFTHASWKTCFGLHGKVMIVSLTSNSTRHTQHSTDPASGSAENLVFASLFNKSGAAPDHYGYEACR